MDGDYISGDLPGGLSIDEFIGRAASSAGHLAQHTQGK